MMRIGSVAGDGDKSSFSTTCLNELVRRSCLLDVRRLIWFVVDNHPRITTALEQAAASIGRSCCNCCRCCQPSGVRDDDATDAEFDVDDS